MIFLTKIFLVCLLSYFSLSASDLVGVAISSNKFKFQIACHESFPENVKLLHDLNDDFYFWFAQFVQSNWKRLGDKNCVFIAYIKRNNSKNIVEWTINTPNKKELSGVFVGDIELQKLVISMFKKLIDPKVINKLKNGVWLFPPNINTSSENDPSGITFCCGPIPGDICLQLSSVEQSGEFLNHGAFQKKLQALMNSE